MNKENKTIIKALNMYGRVPEQWELLEEIERLKGIIEEQERIYQEALDNNEEIKIKNRRLNNIINKAIEYIKSNEKEYGSLEENEKIILDILKGSDN